jgi:hypothetical protein
VATKFQFFLYHFECNFFAKLAAGYTNPHYDLYSNMQTLCSAQTQSLKELQL